jgi:hypothetical protein
LIIENNNLEMQSLKKKIEKQGFIADIVNNVNFSLSSIKKVYEEGKCCRNFKAIFIDLDNQLLGLEISKDISE